MQSGHCFVLKYTITSPVIFRTPFSIRTLCCVPRYTITSPVIFRTPFSIRTLSIGHSINSQYVGLFVCNSEVFLTPVLQTRGPPPPPPHPHTHTHTAVGAGGGGVACSGPVGSAQVRGHADHVALDGGAPRPDEGDVGGSPPTHTTHGTQQRLHSQRSTHAHAHTHTHHFATSEI